MLLGVRLAGVGGVLVGVLLVGSGRVGVVRGFFVVARLVVLGGFGVVLGGLGVVGSGLFVALGGFFGHGVGFFRAYRRWDAGAYTQQRLGGIHRLVARASVLATRRPAGETRKSVFFGA